MLSHASHRDPVRSQAEQAVSKADRFAEFRERHVPFVESHLPIPVPEDLPAPQQELYVAMNYSLNSGGKRLRPLLVIGAGEYLGAPAESLVPLFKSVEYLHTASLILDDLPAQDDAGTRRGRPTCHIAFGEHVAQLAAVSLIAQAFETLGDLDSPAGRKNEVFLAFSRAIGAIGLCGGQAIDLWRGSSVPPTIEELEHRYDLKTGVGLVIPVEAVCIVTGAPAGTADGLCQYARHLGCAFQIGDDLLEVCSDPALTGKDAGSDAKNGTATAVSLLGEAGARERLKFHLDSAGSALDALAGDTGLFRSLLESLGSRRS